jgi:hypothetical protein
LDIAVGLDQPPGGDGDGLLGLILGVGHGDQSGTATPADWRESVELSNQLGTSGPFSSGRSALAGGASWRDARDMSKDEEVQ